MGTGSDVITQPMGLLHQVSWRTSQRRSWFLDAYLWWQQLYSSGWYPPTSSGGYDRQYQGGIGGWCRDASPKSKNHPDNKNKVPNVPQKTLLENTETAVMAWSHPKMCSWSHLQFSAMHLADGNVAWLYEDDHIVNPPSACALANRKSTSSYPAET